MRILLVLEATIGGTRRHLRDLALELRERGFAVHIAYSALRDPDFVRDLTLFRSNGIGLTEIPMRRGPSPLRDLGAVLRLRRLIRKFAPDIIHLHSTKAGFIGRISAIGTGIRVLYTPHCFAFEMESRLRPLYRLTERMLAPLTDGLIAVCESEANAARSIGYSQRKILVVYNGVSPAPSPPKTKGKSIAFIGRNCRQKGVDILLEAWKKLRKVIPEASLTVMSDLDNAMRKAFTDAGAIVRDFGTAEEAAALLADSAILAIPSRWEAFPYLLLEALSNGLAVVAADVGGVRECVRDRENGLLVKAGDAQELAMALQELLVSNSLRQRLASAAVDSVVQFSLGRMVDGTAAIYRKKGLIANH
jgi:glycosyltransferase involved in cell wall biosynthesis